MAPELIWLIVATVLALVELIFGAFAAFCPAIGALIAAAIAAFGLGIEAQLTGMIAGGAIAFIFLGPLVNKHASRDKVHVSNMDALVGRTAHVETPYDGKASYGRIKIDGDSWQIVNHTAGEPIERGTLVKVVGYDSIILIVKPI